MFHFTTWAWFYLPALSQVTARYYGICYFDHWLHHDPGVPIMSRGWLLGHCHLIPYLEAKLAVQTMNIVPTAECVFVHLSGMDTKLPAAAASRNRKRRTFGNNCSFMGTAVDHIKMVSKVCGTLLPVRLEYINYSKVVFQRMFMLELYRR